MKRTLQLAAIVLVGSSFSLAQIHGIGASATSITPHNPTPGIPASVTSLGPRGFGDGGAHFGQHFGPGVNTTVVVGSGGVRFGQRPVFIHPRPGFVSTRPRYFPVAPVYAYPVAYPVYVDPSYYGGYYVDPQTVEDPNQPVYGAVTNQYDPAAYQPVAPADAAAENRARQATDDARYGDHYLDARDGGRTRTDLGGGVTVQRGEPIASAPTAEAKPAEREADEPGTVLVFKDGHRVEVHNYAIVGNTVWDLSEHLAKRIMLDDLDLDATMKVNDERGTPFRYPRTRS